MKDKKQTKISLPSQVVPLSLYPSLQSVHWLSAVRDACSRHSEQPVAAAIVHTYAQKKNGKIFYDQNIIRCNLPLALLLHLFVFSRLRLAPPRSINLHLLLSTGYNNIHQ